MNDWVSRLRVHVPVTATFALAKSPFYIITVLPSLNNMKLMHVRDVICD